MKPVSTPASREWLETHFKNRLDEMSVSAVQEKGWTDEAVLNLQKILTRWNGILDTKVELKPFNKKTIHVKDGKPVETTCIVDGILYLNLAHSSLMDCPDHFTRTAAVCWNY